MGSASGRRVNVQAAVINRQGPLSSLDVTHRIPAVAGQAGGGGPYPGRQSEVTGGAAQHAQEVLFIPGCNQQ